MRTLSLVALLSICCLPGLWAQTQKPTLPYGSVVLPLSLDQEIVDAAGWQAGDHLWLEVAYRFAPRGDIQYIEPAEQVIWIGDQALLFLGATGSELPHEVVSRGTAFVSVSDGESIAFETTIYPRRDRLRLQQDGPQLEAALKKMLPGVDGAYLSQVANFLAGNLASLDVIGTSYSISGYGPVVNSAGEWTGVPVTESQNLFETVNSDAGSATADTPVDSLTIAGAGIASTSIVGDTLTITATEADGDDANELQDVFVTVVGDVGSTTADTQTDTLNIVGTGTVATTVAGDTVTIAGTGLTAEVDGSTTNELQDLFATVVGDVGSTTADTQTDVLNIVGTGTVATTVAGDTLTIAGSGLTEEVDGSTTNELQDLFATFVGDVGSTTADTQTDVLNIVGTGTVATTVAGDTLTIAGSGLTAEVDGSITNELQNLFVTVVGDVGSTTADTQTDVLNIVGTGTVVTTVAGDTLTIAGSGLTAEVDGSTTNELQDLFATVAGNVGSTTANTLTDVLNIVGTGTVATTVAGDTLTISGTGLTEEVDGSTTNELQDLFATVAGNVGSTTANTQTDVLNIVGTGTVATTVVGDTLTIAGTGLTAEVDGSTTNELQDLFATVAGNVGSTTANSQTDVLNIVGTGTVATTVSGDTLTIAGIGLTAEVDGSTTNELQDLFATVASDAGNTSANVQNDTLTVTGSGLATTSISGDTLTIDATIANDSLDFAQFSDALVLDASTTVDMDSNGADLNIDNDTLFLDSSANRVGMGTAMPQERLHLASGNFLQTPGNLAIVSSLGIGTNPVAVVVSGHYAYSIDTGSKLFRVMDVSNPGAPTLTGSFVLGNSPSALFVSGRYAYVVDTNSRDLKVIDISDPSAPSLTGSLATGFEPRAVFVSGRYAYIADGIEDDLKIMDISDPSAPSQVGNLVIGGTPQAVVVLGHYAYVVDDVLNVFKVIDVEDPTTPSLTGSLGIGDIPKSLAVSGRYAYVVDWGSSDLKVIDISDPSAPSLAGSLALGRFPKSVAVSGRYAYVVDLFTDDLKVIDISDPSTPSLVSSLAVGGEPQWVTVSGRYAYVVDRASVALKVIDVSGAEVTAMMAHSLEAGNLQVSRDINAQGHLQVAGGVNIGAGGLFSDGNVGVSGSIAIANDLAPTSSPANLVQLYSEDNAGSAEFKVRDEAGNVTTLSPHNFSLIGTPSEPMAWSFYSEREGQAINVDMLKAIRLLEQISGEKLVHLEGLANVEIDPDQDLRKRMSVLEDENAMLKSQNVDLMQEIQTIKSMLRALE